ncbi:putative GGDEF domain signaling protein [Allomeiothermus silvanus DSM 9946]|uniref:GGDEF domain signaling protein n=1 Tax=Allomeiothermus silvanus (strain ATCC 700542 / DSM 9946 / NBRC 106475 / NCIMB 13440 / VI-R2) TaxID=526227 RepID=D7BEP0_ALLS1|nr:putative GGDEF domain signaling protein [Allomeiothermus silvanus DSM 9946]
MKYRLSALFYLFIILASLLLGLREGVWGQASAYTLPWLMIFTATTASAYGPYWGFLAAGVSALLLPDLNARGGLPRLLPEVRPTHLSA